MASSVVQFGTFVTDIAAPTVVLGATPTVGNTLVAILAADVTSSGVPTAGAGRPYTQRLKNVNNQEFTLWTRLIASGDSATTTFALTGTFPSAVAVVEVQGTYDTVGTVSSTINVAATARTCTGLTPTTIDNLVLAIVGLHNLGALSGGVADNAFTVVASRYGPVGSTQAGLIIASRLTGSTAATGTTTVSWTGNANDRSGAQIAFTGIAGGATLSGTVVVALGAAGTLERSSLAGAVTATLATSGVVARSAFEGATAATSGGAGTVARSAVDGAAPATSATSGTLARSELAGAVAVTSSTAGTLEPAPVAGIAGTVTATSGNLGTVGRSPAAGTVPVAAGAQGAVARSQVGGTASAVSTLVGQVARSAAGGAAAVVAAVFGAVARSQVAGTVAVTSAVVGTLAVDPSSQFDVTVTASVAPRRWAGALSARARTGTLEPRRWEGTLR